ncbi:hypothetical protein [Acetilactobacillus jinshanensis]|uniref:Uncharacterized protein n=1 Tax=Acetilactobacillus jinshanensis TaxID=1720083 RepID=A0A4V1ALI4_9LACO|nr:hypothetical protein [Acetilactobacillus jinshanensis]QBP17709.1 hypothetical protein ELX58_00585 [Acetilactobacillus jinshanensis]URL61747.1 hypothetical protein HGK75_07365 [uncultured bacterium]
MDQRSVNERLKAAPNPIIDNYRKIVCEHKKQIIDNNHVGWKVLELMVYKNRHHFFHDQGHWRSWKDTTLQDNARSMTEKSVSIGLMLTKYWQGQPLNMMQSAMIKPYVNLSKTKFLR